jgi:release factor glutamine methyltransferase
MAASLQTIVETLHKAETYLARSGVESPKVEAEWLFAETLGIRRLELFLQYDRPLDEEQLASLRERVQRRAAGEPLAYIVGSAAFRDLRLWVRPGVLIPRPETERLVDLVLDKLREVPSPRVVDLGTGSGAIALAIASECPEARVLAIDASAEALRQARANAEALGLRERVAFRKGDWLAGQTFTADAIVANPPYLTEEEWQTAQPHVREHEPREALVAPEGGLADLRRILAEAVPRLAPGGTVFLETGIAHAEALRAVAADRGFIDVAVVRDQHGRERFLIARRPT